MGNQCFISTSNKLYQKQLNELNLHELKSQWSLIKSCKIKRMFEKLADKPYMDKEEMRISYEGFCELFPQFIRYEEMQKKRIYDIFDRENRGYVGWNDFYNSISICYFAEQKILATLLFMIFDQHLQKQIDQFQLSLLIDLNAIYLKQQNRDGSNVDLDPEQVVQNLLDGKKSINLNEWLAKSFEYFDFNQFRRLFNIFREEKLEKQLVQNFNDWNDLYSEDQNKYVSYIISFKWFQAWKIYVESQYGISFSIEDKNPVTMKSIKTKKTFKTSNSNKSKKFLAEHPITVKKILGSSNSSIIFSIFDENNVSKNRNGLEEIKNYDLIRSIIGERPKQIYNGLLQGQFAGTFKMGLVQNRDYVFVSQKVWSHLVQIYNGQPEFRRTGFDQIELNPKMIRIYYGTSKGEIQYSSELYREMSNYRTIEDLMTKCLEFSNEYVQKISLYYRTIGMPTWSKIINYTDVLIDLTPNDIILMVYIQNKGQLVRKFQQKYLNIPRSVQQANLLDILTYEDESNKISKQVLFFNKTVENKYIIHFMGESYTNDICLSEKEFFKRCKVNYLPDSIIRGNKKKTKIDKKRRGIEDMKNISFVTSLILQYFENKNIRESLSSLFNRTTFDSSDESKRYLSVILAYLNQLLKKNQQVNPRSIIHLVEVFFPQFSNFDITQLNQFINEFCTKIQDEAELLRIPDIFGSDYEFSLCSKTKCQKCGNTESEMQKNLYVLPVSIPDQSQAHYQVIFVPFCLSVNGHSVKRYGFHLSKRATLKEYKNKLIEVAELKNRNFVLLEVEGHMIVKNYNYVKDESATLQNLHLREDDTIYAYELCFDFTNFVRNHFSFTENDNLEIEQKDLKIGEMIDCKSPQRGWISGKIVEKQILPYTYQQNLKVAHKINNNRVQCRYQVVKNIVAYFPSQSYKNCEQYHLKLIQRVFSEANNKMVNCNMPLVIALPSWMRLKQFQYLTYMQVKRFISPQHAFQDESPLTSHIGSTIQKSIMRQATKMKVKKFKQYLYGKSIPYKLNFIDNSGRCLICYKFVKSIVYSGQQQEFCQGCPLSSDEPINWQIAVNDLIIVIDWKSPWSFKTDVIKNHSSYVNLSNKRKKDIETIESCLSKTLNETTDYTEMICCNMYVDVTITRTIHRLPNYLTISLERIVEENGFKRKINRPVFFGDEKITVQGQQYKLIGVITSKGHQNNISYTTYIKDWRQNDKNRWLAYNGQRVEVIKKEEIDKRCTLILFYEKVKAISQKLQKVQFKLAHNKPSLKEQYPQQQNYQNTISFNQAKSEKQIQIFSNDKFPQFQDEEQYSNYYTQNQPLNQVHGQNKLNINVFEIGHNDFDIE